VRMKRLGAWRCQNRLMWWQILTAVVGGLLLAWAGLLIALWVARPQANRIPESLRLLPDVVRLLSRLAGDASLPRGVRVRLWAVTVYLAIPVDLVPDFIPVIGYADDAIIVAAVLRSVVSRAGSDALRRHWTGTVAGLDAVRRIAGLPAT
jgi:uncharacterized membrane protein YkvA (DUF1232 family)